MKKIIRPLLIIVSLSCSSLSVSGQESPGSGGLYLDLPGGVGYGIFRDQGASPLTYQGLELHPSLGLSWHSPCWRLSGETGLLAGAYGTKLSKLSILGGQFYLRLSALRRCWQGGRWSLWAGASADDLFDIRYNDALGNSCTGVGNQVRLGIAGRAECSLSHWVLHGEVGIVPVAAVLRPGYAYVANYDRDISNPVANTFEQYRWYAAGVCGLSSDLGATLLLPNGNRFGLSYRWQFITSRTASEAPWLFEAASHWLCWNFGFLLSRPAGSEPPAGRSEIHTIE